MTKSQLITARGRHIRSIANTAEMLFKGKGSESTGEAVATMVSQLVYFMKVREERGERADGREEGGTRHSASDQMVKYHHTRRREKDRADFRWAGVAGAG